MPVLHIRRSQTTPRLGTLRHKRIDVDALVPPHIGAVSLHMMRRGRAPHVEIQPLAVRRLDDAGEHPHLRRRLILTIQTEVGVTKVRLTMLVSQLVCA